MLCYKQGPPSAPSGCYYDGCFLQRICPSQSSPSPWHHSAPWQPGPGAGPVTVHPNKASTTVSSAVVTVQIGRELRPPSPDGNSRSGRSEVGGHHVLRIWAPSLVMANAAGASLPWGLATEPGSRLAPLSFLSILVVQAPGQQTPTATVIIPRPSQGN